MTDESGRLRRWVRRLRRFLKRVNVTLDERGETGYNPPPTDYGNASLPGWPDKPPSPPPHPS